MEEVCSKSTLKRYKLQRMVERYLWSVLGQEDVKLLFRLRTGSAGLLEEN